MKLMPFLIWIAAALVIVNIVMFTALGFEIEKATAAKQSKRQRVIGVGEFYSVEFDGHRWVILKSRTNTFVHHPSCGCKE